MALWKRAPKLGPLKPTANPYPSRFQKWRHSLVLRFLIILVIGLTIRFYPPIYNFTQTEVFEGTSMIQGAFEFPLRQSKILVSDAVSYFSLKEDYDNLKNENKLLKMQIQQLMPLKNENSILKTSLNVKEKFQPHSIGARVISSPYDGLHYFLIIAGGTQDKIEQGQAVITADGIVGHLVKVGKYVSRVLLVNDLNSKIPVVTAHSGQNAILAGSANEFPKLVYVKDASKIEPYEPILTSGFGGVFPPGLPVGIINKIDGNDIHVKPYVNYNNLEWVQVLQTPEGYLDEVKTTLEGT